MKYLFKLFFALILILNSNSFYAQKIATTEKSQELAQKIQKLKLKKIEDQKKLNKVKTEN